MKSKNFHRLLFLDLSLLLLFCFIVIQFFKIQILEEDRWVRQAKMQHHFFLVEPFKRGRFFSNPELKRGHPTKAVALAFDMKHYRLHVDPIAIPTHLRGEIVDGVGEILHLNEGEKREMHKHFDKRCRSRRIHSGLSEVDKKLLEEWWNPYARQKKIPRNALFPLEDYRRVYPYEKLLGVVLHGVRDERDPNTNQAIPTGGAELFFDAYLRGKAGKRSLLRSPRHPMEGGLLITLPEDGADVYLSIDHYIQTIAEEEIEAAVKRAGAKSGWVVMMDPNSGEIYALAQYPFFSPSDYRKFYADQKLIDATKVHAVTDCFEPGSTMKPISVAVAMLANEELKKRGSPPIFNPADMLPTHSGIFPGRKFPLHDVGHHQFLNMYLAIQKSSNIYVAKLIQRIIEVLGDEWYRTQLQNVFGFGVSTGIELPGESSGMLPTPGKGSSQWSTPTPYSLSIGYNVLASSIQLMRAFAIIANGGYGVKPTIVRKIVKDGRVIFPCGERERVRVLNQKISREVVCALKFVTKPGGSGVRADIPGYTEAGKTGTTEKVVQGAYSRKHHVSSFIGFSPAANPKFLLYVAIDEPEYSVRKGHFGGCCAAPTFKHIMQRTFQYLGIPPDDPYGYSPQDPRTDSKKADWSGQVALLREVYLQWNR